MVVRVISIVVAGFTLLAVLVWWHGEESDPRPIENEAAASKTVESNSREKSSARGDREENVREVSDSDEGGEGTSLLTGGEPDWEEIEDVDARWAELRERADGGDARAMYEMHKLARDCMMALGGLSHMEEQVEQEQDPDARQDWQEQIDKYTAIEPSCSDSPDLSNPSFLTEQATTRLWQGAEAGHADAMYQAVFEPMGAATRPEDLGLEDEEAMLEKQRQFAEELREGCHANGLHSMGTHLVRGTAVVEGLSLGRYSDVSEEKGRQMEGFAHRYAAARIEDESRPAQEACNPDHPLTAAEERRAMSLADDILADCP